MTTDIRIDRELLCENQSRLWRALLLKSFWGLLLIRWDWEWVFRWQNYLLHLILHLQFKAPSQAKDCVCVRYKVCRCAWNNCVLFYLNLCWWLVGNWNDNERLKKVQQTKVVDGRTVWAFKNRLLRWKILNNRGKDGFLQPPDLIPHWYRAGVSFFRRIHKMPMKKVIRHTLCWSIFNC